MSNAELDDDRINDRIHFAQRTVLEVCGVDLNGNGRSCNAPHICCGNHVNHGDIVYLKTDLQTNNDGEIEDVVKVFKVDCNSGLSTCHVGCLPNRFLALHDKSIFEGVYLHINKDYRIANSCIDIHKSY
jgi:hypothetical protein